jgi:PKD repeat protein
MGMIPLTVLFDGSSSSDFDGNIVSYTWDFGDGTSDNSETATHTYETGGDFTATLIVTDNDGKTGTASQNIIVYQKPEASFTASPEIGIAPLEVSFDATASVDVDGQVESYQWDFGDGMTGDSEEIVHTYSTAGTFLVVLTAMDDFG